MLKTYITTLSFLLLCISIFGQGQDTLPKPQSQSLYRPLRYKPDAGDFVIVNGTVRFNRALYGNNTAFRMEAGDVPEFAFYLPGYGGTVKLGLIAGSESKWLVDAQRIEARYRPGYMIYHISDSLLGSGEMTITAIGLADADGGIVKVECSNVSNACKLVIAYGGASGKKFSRNGDLKVDPVDVFYLKAQNCKDNRFVVSDHSFSLSFGNKGLAMQGIWPTGAVLKLANAGQMESPLRLLESNSGELPLITGVMNASTDQPQYFLFQNPKAAKDSSLSYTQLPAIFNQAETYRKHIADRVHMETPDSFINTLGATLAVAADAIWEDPTWMHGAVGWRMRLNGWRGPYAGDPLGWHDRARTHFSAYAKSQVTAPDSGPSIADSAKNYARQLEKMGTALYTSGYICRNPDGDFRPHHYDMNLVYVDALLRHLMWTGDTAYVRSMWPVLKRHFAWERRNFDADGDGLYDAYCCIWASDALEYSGGGVAHSSAYNYFANCKAAQLASMIGENPTPFRNEADRILKAMNSILWMPQKGWYAEFRDYLGLKRIHPSAALWTVYHVIDSEVPDAFQAYQLTRYLDREIPHFPVLSNDMVTDGAYVLSTTNWMPYEWSTNNVVMAENLHGALALWQTGQADNAFRLWKGAVLDAMYLGSSPGNFVQTSYYDAHCGEAYRDFADEIGMGARSLVEGLFGIVPDLLDSTITIAPGFPSKWNAASLSIPDVSFDFKRTDGEDVYRIQSRFRNTLRLKLKLKAETDSIALVTVNDQMVNWELVDSAVGNPQIEIEVPRVSCNSSIEIKIGWAGQKPEMMTDEGPLSCNENFHLSLKQATILDIFDPQQVLGAVHSSSKALDGMVKGEVGSRTVFVKLGQGQLQWWQPLSIEVGMPVAEIPSTTNNARKKFEMIPMRPYFNDKVTQIFKNKYLAPRCPNPTLAIPQQGIGDWCSTGKTANIDDAGLRALVTAKGSFATAQGVRFASPPSQKNILFTSLWNNYPARAEIPLTGKAAHAYLLMAGSTNPMQSRMTNAVVYFEYTDGTADSLELRNPENWWPIEQNYDSDAFAFRINAPKPARLYLKTGTIVPGEQLARQPKVAIDGGAATFLDLPLNPSKTLKKLVLKTLANEVVVGLMAVTLER